MNPANAISLLSSNIHTMGTLTLFVQLLMVHTLLGLLFHCPGSRVMALVYGLMCLLLPVIALFMLGLLLRRRRSPGLAGSECDSFSYVLYTMMQAGRAPLIWFLISMIDGRIITCIALNTNLDWRLQSNFMPGIQVSGMLLLVIFLVLDYSIPQFTWARGLLSSFYQERHKDLILQEVEIVFQQKAEGKRKAFIQHLMQDEVDTLQPEHFVKEKTSEIVWKYKELVQKQYEERSLSVQEAKAFTADSAGSQDPKTFLASSTVSEEIEIPLDSAESSQEQNKAQQALSI